MSQVNLLPPDIRQRQQSRRMALLVVAGGGVILAVILAFYALQFGTVSGVNDDIAQQESTNAQLQTQIADLQKFKDLQGRAQAKQALLDQAYANEVSFSGLLMDLSREIPTNEYLTDLSVQLNVAPTDATGAATPTTPTVFVGSITASGGADTVPTITSWLTNLEMVKGWVNSWVTTVDRTDQDGVVTENFTSSADLTNAVVTERGLRASQSGVTGAVGTSGTPGTAS